MMYGSILDELRSEGRLRSIPPHRKAQPLVDLCSNDYMALGRRADEWREEFHGRFPRVGMTSSASRLLAADQEVYFMLEDFLAQAYGRPALLFNSGYHANTGLIGALSCPGTLWLSDKLIHASAIDGIRLASADYRRVAHNDAGAVRRAVEKFSGSYERVIILVESIYSMDGDTADLAALRGIKREFPGVMLYVDEAHAVGAVGPRGLGLSAEAGVLDDVDILVGTFGKACASAGAFAIMNGELKEYIVNTARSLIFSTALPPVSAAWSLLMLEKLTDMDGLRLRLREIGRRFRSGIEEITGRPNPSRSAIVPMLTGDARKAVALSHELERNGILALPIRRPTVPPGGERIRFSLNASLSAGETDRLLHVISMIADR